MKIERFNEKFNVGTPEKGDYVICNSVSSSETSLNDFICYNVGIILDIRTKEIVKYPYMIKYEDLPEYLVNYSKNYDYNTIPFKEDEILYWSKNKEELENILFTNKFNL